MTPERLTPPPTVEQPRSDEEKAVALKDKLDGVDRSLKDAVNELQGLEALISMDVGNPADQQRANEAYQGAFAKHQEILAQSEELHKSLLMIDDKMKGLVIE